MKWYWVTAIFPVFTPAQSSPLISPVVKPENSLWMHWFHRKRERGGRDMFVFNRQHGWEIAIILRNFRKTKLSKSIFFFFFFLLYFNMYTMCDSTTFALRHTQISLSGILRHFARQAAIFFCTRMIQTSEPGIRRGNEDSRKNENRKQIDKHTLFFKQSVGVAESMEITRERMRVCQQNRALMELLFVDICIFQAISMTEV